MSDRLFVRGVRRMSLSRWGKGGDSDHATGLNWDTRLVGPRKIPAWQRAKLPRYRREGAVEVRPFPAEKRLPASEAQGLSAEAMSRNRQRRRGRGKRVGPNTSDEHEENRKRLSALQRRIAREDDS